MLFLMMMTMVSAEEWSKKGLQLYKSEFNDDAVVDVVDDDDDVGDAVIDVVDDDDDDDGQCCGMV